ncbi:unnamed protein product [Fraxinus pennsylvanica]|uniref:Uncharacterized protein n=1 Tax=Fraxinus pennsylvanica TaxID=56036 RepID=A0AAD2A3H3_9LAMI|nr:unnamed protein product [Fraxinus pennsylvanica]
MEKLLNPYHKEYMKMAMLKHEETFQEQVFELHRLYRIQKILMKDIVKTTRKGQDYAIASIDQINEFEDESELELTLGLKSYNGRRKAGETLPPSDSGLKFSSSSLSDSARTRGKEIAGERSLFLIMGS